MSRNAAALVAILFATFAFAQGKKAPEAKAAAPTTTPAAPVPPPAIAAHLATLDGSWKCAGKAHPSPWGPGGPLSGITLTAKVEAGGFAQTWRFATEASAQFPVPYLQLAIVGSDGKDGLRRSDIDTMGAALQATSKGWVSDKMVWEGELSVGPQKVGHRQTLSRKGATELASLVEMQATPGTWVKVSELTCTK